MTHRRARTHRGVTHLAELRNPAILCRLVRFRARGLLKPRGRAAEFFISQSHFKSPYSYSQPVVSFLTVVVPSRHPALGPEAERSRCGRPFRRDSSPGRLESRGRMRTWTEDENADWRRFRGDARGVEEGPMARPRSRKGVGKLANCYGASSGTLRRNSATLGELGGRVGELARDTGGLGRGC